MVTLSLVQVTPVHLQGFVWVVFHSSVRPPNALRSDTSPALSEARSESAMAKTHVRRVKRIASLTCADFISVVRVVRGKELVIYGIGAMGTSMDASVALFCSVVLRMFFKKKKKKKKRVS